MKRNEWFANFGENVLIKYKYLFFIAFTALLYVSILGIKQIIMDNSYKSMLKKDNPISKKNDHFQEIFGNNDYIYLLVEADEIIDPQVFSYIRELSEIIEEKLPFVKEVKSFTSIEFLEIDGDEIIADNLIGENIPTSDSALFKLKTKIFSKLIYKDRLINDSANQTGILIKFNNFPDTVYVCENSKSVEKNGIFFNDDIINKIEYAGLNKLKKDNYKRIKDARLLIAPAISYILDKYQNESCTITPTGLPIITYNVYSILQKETGRSFAITLLIVILILAFMYRSFRSVFVPVFIILASVIITFGIIGWLKIVVSTFALIVALLLLVISVGYSIHLINHFRKSFFEQGNRKIAIRYMFEHAGWPCFVAAITTVIGFLSFVFVDMVPVQNLGITSAIGVFVTYILVMFFIPTSFSFGSNKKIEKQSMKFKGNIRKNELLSNLSYFSLNNSKIIIAVTALLIIASSISIFNIKADTDFINLFGDGNKFVRDAKHATENLGSLYSYEVLIELPEPDMAKNPEVLFALNGLDSLINSFSTTKTTSSINDLLKDINQTMHGADPAYYSVSDNRNLIAQYLLLYEMAGGKELENYVDFNYQKLRHSIRIKRSTTDLNYDFEKIQAYSKQNFPKDTKVSIVGDMSIFLRAVSSLVHGQIISIIFAFIGILLVLIFTLKSFKFALLAMIPNVVPVFLLIGIMAPLGITLNLQTIVAAPVIMGLAVDDTVHFFLHFKSEFAQNKSYRIANRNTFVKVGSAIINTTLILFLGFLSFYFTCVNSLRDISVLLVVGASTALFADILLAPILFVIFKPFGKEKLN